MSPDLINICSCSRWAAPGFVDYSKQERVCFLNCCLNDLHFYSEIHLHILQSFLTAPNPISLCKCALCKLFDSSQSYPWMLIGMVGTQFVRGLCCCSYSWQKGSASIAEQNVFITAPWLHLLVEMGLNFQKIMANLVTWVSAKPTLLKVLNRLKYNFGALNEISKWRNIVLALIIKIIITAHFEVTPTCLIFFFLAVAFILYKCSL